MVSKVITITNATGLHARPASMFVQTAGKYKSKIEVVKGDARLNAKSIMGIMSGGIAGNGIKGIGLTLKDFSLPVSMSFRLFGALLSGLLVTELVYYYIHLSFVLPVAVGVMFTLLHALIQTYVLTMLTALFYGEVTEPTKRKAKEKTKLRRKRT